VKERERERERERKKERERKREREREREKVQMHNVLALFVDKPRILNTRWYVYVCMYVYVYVHECVRAKCERELIGWVNKVTKSRTHFTCAE
jgi:hypothetical protein